MRLPIRFLLVAVFIVGCDKGYSATIRNDLDQDVIVKYAFDSERLIDEGGGPLHPGRFASVGEVRAPGLRPKLLLKAFDLQRKSGVLPTPGVRRLPRYVEDRSAEHPIRVSSL